MERFLEKRYTQSDFRSHSDLADLRITDPNLEVLPYALAIGQVSRVDL